jgi:negative regulator of sigma E activity
MNEAIRMQLSAFVDGELPENEAELLLRRLSQDAELRQQVSEYLAIGRVMRGEPQVHGLNALRDRIACALDDAPIPEAIAEPPPARQRLLRPVAGFAVAATVALVAILGLRQGGDTPTTIEPGTVVAGAEAITQPEVDDVLEQYRRAHIFETAPQSIDTRLTGFTLPEESEAATEEPEPVDDDAAADESPTEPTDAE